MKIQSQVEIEKDIAELILLIQDVDNTLQWLEGLQSVKHLSGTQGQPGAISDVVLDSPAGRMHIKETVISKNLPEEYIMRYDGKGYVSYSNYSFEELSNGNTRFTMVQHVELKGALKLASGFVKGKITSQLEKSAQSFKRFAESQ